MTWPAVTAEPRKAEINDIKDAWKGHRETLFYDTYVRITIQMDNSPPQKL